MFRRFAVSLGCVLLFGAAVRASATTVDFEGFGDGSVLGAVGGAAFSNAIVLSAGISLNEIDFPPHSGTNVASDSAGAISIAFAVPAASVSGFFTYLEPLTLTAFDALDQQVGQAISLFSNNAALSGDPGSSPNESIGIDFAGGISRLVIAGDPNGGSFTLDDLNFTSVPEPGTLALLLPGLAAFGLRRPRRVA
jgi:hypothetical protein